MLRLRQSRKHLSCGEYLSAEVPRKHNRHLYQRGSLKHPLQLKRMIQGRNSVYLTDGGDLTSKHKK